MLPISSKQATKQEGDYFVAAAAVRGSDTEHSPRRHQGLELSFAPSAMPSVWRARPKVAGLEDEVEPMADQFRKWMYTMEALHSPDVSMAESYRTLALARAALDWFA